MRPAAELLMLEADALPEVLARQTLAAMERPTLLSGWRVRDVIAHCGAALHRLVDGEELVFTPEANQVDVEERASWPIVDVTAELFEAYPRAAAAIDAAGGAFDGLGLGEWIHGGDIREPLGEPDAYDSSGIDLAIPLLAARSIAQEAPGVRVHLGEREFDFGVGEPVGELRADAASFVRLCAVRAPDRRRFELTGVREPALVLFS
ncbi:MAG: maleylpyruvate isomerase family mycothiol-dependent enzyme [Ilumatobacteraceae bacterium]